jgi:hypothetical protein
MGSMQFPQIHHIAAITGFIRWLLSAESKCTNIVEHLSRCAEQRLLRLLANEQLTKSATICTLALPESVSQASSICWEINSSFTAQ